MKKLSNQNCRGRCKYSKKERKRHDNPNKISLFPFLTHAFFMICSFFRKMSIKNMLMFMSIYEMKNLFIWHFDHFNFFVSFFVCSHEQVSWSSKNWAIFVAHKHELLINIMLIKLWAHRMLMSKTKCSNRVHTFCSTVCSLVQGSDTLDYYARVFEMPFLENTVTFGQIWLVQNMRNKNPNLTVQSDWTKSDRASQETQLKKSSVIL